VIIKLIANMFFGILIKYHAYCRNFFCWCQYLYWWSQCQYIFITRYGKPYNLHSTIR